MCETRDLGIKWPHWHTLIFSDETRIDMSFVCPGDVKKMLAQRTRSVYWKNWAAKHDHEELKEGAWLEPGRALCKKKVKENWTDKHRNVARKIFLEGGWTQKRLLDIGWSDGKSMSSLSNGGRDRKAQAPPFPRLARDQKGDPRGLQKVRAKNGNFEESGKEVSSRTLPVKINGTGAISAVRYTFIQKHFHPKTLSSKTISSKREDNFIHDTFIPKRVHPMTLSSKNGFVQ